MDKEFYKSLNKITYSEDEVQEYIDLANLSDEDIKKISGSVRTKYGQDQIKYNAEKLKDLLEEDEHVERMIKFRDIKDLARLTVFSSMGMTTLKSNDFAVFKVVCFTNKRMLFVSTNVLNEALVLGWVNNEEIIGTKFTAKKVIFSRKDPSKFWFTRWTLGVIASDLVLLFAFFGDILSDKERFLDLISPLNETDKVIFIRRFYFRDSVNDIAKALNVSAGSISNKILRGKKRLKEYISSN